MTQALSDGTRQEDVERRPPVGCVAVDASLRKAAIRALGHAYLHRQIAGSPATVTMRPVQWL